MVSPSVVNLTGSSTSTRTRKAPRMPPGTSSRLLEAPGVVPGLLRRQRPSILSDESRMLADLGPPQLRPGLAQVRLQIQNVALHQPAQAASTDVSGRAGALSTVREEVRPPRQPAPKDTVCNNCGKYFTAKGVNRHKNHCNSRNFVTKNELRNFVTKNEFKTFQRSVLGKLTAIQKSLDGFQVTESNRHLKIKSRKSHHQSINMRV